MRVKVSVPTRTLHILNAGMVLMYETLWVQMLQAEYMVLLATATFMILPLLERGSSALWIELLGILFDVFVNNYTHNIFQDL